MTTALLSDAHIVGGPADPAQQRLVRFLDTLQVDELVVLGDLFHHWWAFPGEPAGDPACRPTCDALRRLVHRGTRLAYVRGNHDFALGPFFAETLGARIGDSHWRELEGLRTVLAHGDECDVRWSYRLTRRLLRGRPFSGVIGALGPVRGRTLLQGLAGASRDHGGPDVGLVARQRAWAADRVGEGAVFVVMGHSHRALDEAMGEGRYINLGDFTRERTWCLVDGQGPRLMVAGADGDAAASTAWAGR